MRRRSSQRLASGGDAGGRPPGDMDDGDSVLVGVGGADRQGRSGIDSDGDSDSDSAQDGSWCESDISGGTASDSGLDVSVVRRVPASGGAGGTLRPGPSPRPALRLRLRRQRSLAAHGPPPPSSGTAGGSLSAAATAAVPLMVAAAVAASMGPTAENGSSSGGCDRGSSTPPPPATTGEAPDAAAAAPAPLPSSVPRPAGFGHFNYLDGRCSYCDADPWHARRYCPARECYLCRAAGHLFTSCPYRLAPTFSSRANEARHAVVGGGSGGAGGRSGSVFLGPLSSEGCSLITPHYVATRAALGTPPAFRGRLRRRHRLGGDVAVAAAAVRMLPTRVSCLTVPLSHPRLVVAGDAAGALGVWRHNLLGSNDTVSPASADLAAAGGPDDSITTSAGLHGTAAITALTTDPDRAPDLVYSTGTDGTLRHVSLATLGSATAAAAVVAPPLFTAADVGYTSPFAVGFTALAADSSRGLLYVSDGRGGVHLVDPRTPRTTAAAVGGWRAHAGRRVNSVEVNPADGRLVATTGNDRAMRLWDVRRLPPATVGGRCNRRVVRGALGGVTADRSVSGAAFSPHTGTRLLVTGAANRVWVWADVHALVGMAVLPRLDRFDFVSKRTVVAPHGAGAAGAAAATAVPTSTLIHSHDWPGFPAAFAAAWDPHPDNWRETSFVCGRFLGEEVQPPLPSARSPPASSLHPTGDAGGRRRPRVGGRPVTVHPVDLFDAPDGRHWSHAAALADPRLTTICTLNALHPTAPLLVSASSYSVYLWAPEHPRDDGDHESDGKGGFRRRGGSGGGARCGGPFNWKRRPVNKRGGDVQHDSENDGGGCGGPEKREAAAAVRYATMRRRS
ncbi:hypothetical protein MMPV_002755 [Pyropia vietnamensis]